MRTFDDDQVELAQMAAQAFRAVSPGTDDGVTSLDPAELRGRLRDLGLALMAVPEAHGGLGLSEVDAVLVLEEVGYAGLPAIVGETVGLAAPMVSRYGSEAQRERWLPALAEGVWGTAVCPTTGPLLADGTDAVLVEHGARVHVVGLAGWRSRGHAALNPATALAPEATREFPVRGAWVAATILNGTSRRLLDHAVEYARIREQFAVPIGSFQAIRHMLVDVAAATESARPTAWRLAASLAAAGPGLGPDVEVLAHVAKAAAGRAGSLANDHALQVHGGIGFTREHPLHTGLIAGHDLEHRWGDAASHELALGRIAIGPADLVATFVP